VGHIARADFMGREFSPGFGGGVLAGQDPGRLVGGVYAANTVGAIVGSLAFSLLLIPLAGTKGSQQVLILLSAVAGLVALAPMLWRKTPSDGPALEAPLGAPGAVVLAAALGLAVLLAFHVGELPWGVVAYGRFTATYGDVFAPARDTKEEEVPRGGGKWTTYCEYVGEGLNGTVAVTMRTDGVRSFHSAGKVQASNDPRDMRLQRMLGHISALAFPNPKSVLVVACGAGVTPARSSPTPISSALSFATSSRCAQICRAPLHQGELRRRGQPARRDGA